MSARRRHFIHIDAYAHLDSSCHPRLTCNLHGAAFKGPVFRRNGEEACDWRRFDPDDSLAEESEREDDPFSATRRGQQAADTLDGFGHAVLDLYSEPGRFTPAELDAIALGLRWRLSVRQMARMLNITVQAFESRIKGRQLPDGRVWGGLEKKGARIFLWLFQLYHGRQP